MADSRLVIGVVLPEGYTGASDFAEDCGVEVLGTCTADVFLRTQPSVDPAEQDEDIDEALSDAVSDGEGRLMVRYVKAHLAERGYLIVPKESCAREAIADFMMKRGFATGHGDTLSGLLREFGSDSDPRLEWLGKAREIVRRCAEMSPSTIPELCALISDAGSLYSDQDGPFGPHANHSVAAEF
jgi:hypothetical protein